MRMRVWFVLAFLGLAAGILSAEPLKVIALPVWGGLMDSGFFAAREYEEPDERVFRLDIMQSELKALDPDLAVLTGLNGLPDAAEALSEASGYFGMYSVNRAGFRIGPVGIPWNLREGSVLLAREKLDFQPLETRRFSGFFIKNTVSVRKTTSPQVMGGKITLAGREVYVFSVHWVGMSENPEEELDALTRDYLNRELDGRDYIAAVRDSVRRSEQSLALVYSTLGFINNLAGSSPVLLAGSFNVLPDSKEMEILKQAGFRDAWEAGDGPGYTLDGRRNLNIRRFYQAEERDRRERLDYVLYRGSGLVVKNTKLVFDSPTFGVHPSDRFGVYVQFEVTSAE